MIWLLGVLLALLVLAIVGQRFAYVFQYIFFCRFPLLLALLLLLLPPVAFGPAASVLSNLFVVDPIGVAFATGFALLAAWVVMATIDIQLATIPQRYKPFLRDTPPAPRPLRALYDFTRKASGARAAAFGLLAIPIVLAVVTHSWTGAGGGWLIPSALVGAATAVGLRWAARPIGVYLERLTRSPVERITQRLARAPRPPLGYVESREVATYHLRGAAFLVLTLVVYAIGYWALRPGVWPRIAAAVPALSLVLLLGMLLCIALAGIAFFVDLYRVPVTIIVVVMSFLAFQVSNTDHYYRVVPADTAARGSGASLTPQQAFRAWNEVHPPGQVPVMVVVAAGGGGIAAARWTAQVLTGLAADSSFGKRFADAVAFVSGVSGGSVGAMYFVDRYTRGGPPPQTALDSIRRAAASSSLQAAVWGLLYPDLWRAVPGIVPDRLLDRGWAIEQVWEARLPSRATLGSWSRDAAQGWRPAVAFNATVTESGARFLLTSLGGLIPDTAHGTAASFQQLYPGWDLGVVTAARLSATFPFITPIARPDVPRDLDRVAYHLADGGYYDNFGVMSAIDFLRAVLPDYAAPDSTSSHPRRRVVVLQIRLADSVSAVAANTQGWLYAAAGPAVTMLHVRSAAQRARNDLEVALLQDAWASQGVAIETVTFDLQDHAPLSWQLSPDELARIDSAWDARPAREARRLLRQLLTP